MASRLDNAVNPFREWPAIAFSAGSATLSPQLDAGGIAGFYRLCATANCCFLTCGSAGDAVATTNSALLPAGVVEYIQIPAGGYLSVIGQTGAGQLNITQCR